MTAALRQQSSIIGLGLGVMCKTLNFCFIFDCMPTITRCQSFNTAQLSILTEENPDSISTEHTEDSYAADVQPDGTATLSRPPSRGRRSGVATPGRRVGTSVSALQNFRGSDPWLDRHGIRSASPNMSGRAVAPASSSSTSLDSMEVDGDELAQYNILGMHSPSDEEISGSFPGVIEEEHGQSEEEEDVDEDEDMSDESGSAECEDRDPMEMVGHW